MLKNEKHSKNISWARFNKYLYRYWKWQVFIIALGFLATPLALLNPYLVKLVIDKAYGQKDLKLFLILAVIGGSIFILTGLIDSFRNYLSKRVNRLVHLDMTKDLFRHFQRLPLGFFTGRSTGEHLYRINADTGSVSDFICNTVPQTAILFLRLLCILVIVFYLNRRLALLATLMLPGACIHPYFFGNWMKSITRRMTEKAQDVFRRLHEVFSHIHLVKAFGREDYEIKRFEKTFSEKINTELENAKVSAISGFSGSLLGKAIGGIITLYGGYQVIRGDMTLGSLTAIMIYLTQFIGLVKSIGGFYESIAVNSVARRRLAEILDIAPEIKDREGAVAHCISRGEIEFKNVSFGYEKDKLILKNINFSIKAASKTGLTGRSGCGKTTLLNLILRLYETKKGSILIDGLGVKNIKLKSLKEQIGIALQEPLLWNGTIADNILYGRQNSGYDDMVKAARLAEAHDFIADLPDKYDSVIGEMACKISEGQKQRVAIARALIKKPKILILDEAMSSLDPETESRIIENILGEYKSSTVIIVSHRLSAVRKMDSVYIIQNGSVIKEGAAHDEILNRV